MVRYTKKIKNEIFLSPHATCLPPPTTTDTRRLLILRWKLQHHLHHPLPSKNCIPLTLTHGRSYLAFMATLTGPASYCAFRQQASTTYHWPHLWPMGNLGCNCPSVDLFHYLCWIANHHHGTWLHDFGCLMRLTDLFQDNQNACVVTLGQEFFRVRMETFSNVSTYWKCLQTLFDQLMDVVVPMNNHCLVL